MFNLTRNQSDHTCRKETCLVPSIVHHSKSCAAKKTVSGSSERLHVRRVGIGEGHQHGRSSGISKKADKRKANCSTLLPRITRLKMSIPTSSQSTLAHNGVASYGPMAPCRSHHRNHTRQNWIFQVIRQELSP